MDKKKIGMAGFLAAMFLVLALVIGGAHAAEIEPGHIHIVVKNEAGRPIENATVKLITNASQVLGEWKTNKTGEVEITGINNFTGIIKISADGYKTKQINITYNNTKAYTYDVTLEYDGLTSRAKDIYAAHRTAVIAGGAVIILILLLIVLAVKGKRVRW